MPTTSELRTFLFERLAAFDPTLDVSDGSAADTHIVQPLLERLGTDPLETDIGAFIRARLREAHPELDVREEDVLTDTLANPLSTLLEPFKREINSIRVTQSVAYPSALSDDELDALLVNLFLSRPIGVRARHTVRLYFATPTYCRVTVLTRFYTTGGLNFFPVVGSQVFADTMMASREGLLYYFDVLVQAESEGTDYNVAAGVITKVEGIPSAVSVSNISPIVLMGAGRETNSSYAQRAEASLSERSLNTERGLTARLPELLPAIRSLRAIGYRDPEMERDVLVGRALLSVPGPMLQMNGHAQLYAQQANASTAHFGEHLMSAAYTTRKVRRIQLNGGATFSPVPAAGALVTLYHSNLVPALSEHIVAADPAPTSTYVHLDDWRWLTGVRGDTGFTSTFSVVSNPGPAQPGADLPFTNVLERAAGTNSFLPQADPVCPGDVLYAMHSYGGALSYQSLTVLEVLSAQRVRVGAPITIIGAGTKGSSRPASHGVGDTVVVPTIPQSAVGKIMVLQTNAESPVYLTGLGGNPWFVIQQVSVPAGGLVTVTLDAAPVGGDNLTDLSWSVVDADLDPLPSTTDALLFRAPLGPDSVAFDVLREAPGATILSPTNDTDVVFTQQSMLSAAEVPTTLSLSGIPGGISFPDTEEGTLEIDNNTVHIGGMVDVHLRTTDAAERTETFLLEDIEPLLRGCSGKASSLVDIDNFSGEYNFTLQGVSVHDVLRIRGSAPGSYLITAVNGSALTVINLLAPDDRAFSASYNGINYEILHSTVSAELVDPRRELVPEAGGSPRVLPTDMQTFAGQLQVTTASQKNFATAGVTAGCVLKIWDGGSAGEYAITQVGGPSNERLTLSTPTPVSEAGVRYSVYLPLTGELELPVQRVTKVELLSDDGVSVEFEVPHAGPVDVLARGFSNRGEGVKLPLTGAQGRDLWADAGSPLVHVADNSATDLLLSRVTPGDVLLWLDGDNLAVRQLVSAVTAKQLTVSPVLAYDETGLGGACQAPTMSSFELGALTSGVARCYFINPTFFEVGPDTTFQSDTGLIFLPDPDNKALLSDPELPGVAAVDASHSDMVYWEEDTYQTLRQLGLRVGDLVWFGYLRLHGSTLVGGANVSGETFVVYEHGVSSYTVTFTGENPVALADVQEQLEAVLPTTFLVEVVDDALVLSCQNQITLGSSPANVTLGLQAVTNLHAPVGLNGTGWYLISALDPLLQWGLHPSRSIQLTGLGGEAVSFHSGAPPAEVQLRFYRAATQRWTPAQMALQVENGLYYCDVQVVSYGTGNQYNLEPDAPLVISGHQSDGYQLVPDNNVHSYSTAEKPRLQLSLSLLPPDAVGLLTDRLLTPGCSVQVTYVTVPTVSACQQVLLSDEERVVNDNPLARCFFPAQVLLELSYRGGSAPSVLREALRLRIEELQPGEELTAFDVQSVLRQGGATYAQPMTLVVLEHLKDRTIACRRSTDSVTVGRNSIFVTEDDHLSLVRE